MVWPLAVRSTVSRASGAELREVEGAAVRIIDEADQRLAQQLGFLVAEQALRRLVAALDDAVRRGHQHGVAQAVEHGVQIVLGDGGFVQFLPHALERELQIAELVVAHHGERPGVVALADPVGALDQGGDGPGELAGDEPGPDQSQQKQRQRDAGHQAAHALDLHALLALELLANAGEGLLHFGAAHPDLADCRRAAPGADTRFEWMVLWNTNQSPAWSRRVAAAEQARCRARPILRPVRCRARRAGAAAIDATAVLLPEVNADASEVPVISERLLARAFEVGFQLLRDGGVGELIDVGGIDPVLVVGQSAQYQRQHRADRQGKQQVLGF